MANAFQRKVVHPVLALQRGGDWDYASAMVKVWWDIESAPLPDGPLYYYADVQQVVRSAGYHVPFMFCAAGPVENMNHHRFTGFMDRRVYVKPDENGGSFRSILSDMLFSSIDDRRNKKKVSIDDYPPCNYMLISSNEKFYRALRQLQGMRYNILIARPSTSPCILDKVATQVWNWEDLLQVDNNQSRIDLKREIMEYLCSKEYISHVRYKLISEHDGWEIMEEEDETE